MVESNSVTEFDEKSVGISLYLGDVEPKAAENFISLNCALKHRFSDFIVNEIDKNGEVVWFREETDLQKWKKANLDKTMPGKEQEE